MLIFVNMLIFVVILMSSWDLIVESHGKENSIDTDGGKDEILKEGTGDKCPHLRQEMIWTNILSWVDLVLNRVAGNEHLGRIST